jgi:glycosyltransferase involved in cell wall biosynthesis
MPEPIALRGDPVQSRERAAAHALPAAAIFLIWATPDRGTRSAWFARELGIDDVRFLGSEGRGLGAAPFNYPGQLLRTLIVLARRRPRVVFVQSPPSFAAWTAALYCAVTGAEFVIDAHSDAFQRARWTRPAWLTRVVARRAISTIVTNEHLAGIVRSWGAAAMSIPTIPTDLVMGEPPTMPPGFNVTFVNTWAADEPLDSLLAAAEELPEASFHITGSRKGLERLQHPIPKNVRFTGFLSQPTYNALLAASDAVACLTTHDHTMQNGACEALFLETPIVTSDWPILRDYFSAGTVHVDNTPAGIGLGLRRMMAHSSTYRREIRSLRAQRQREWEANRRTILSQIADRLV